MNCPRYDPDACNKILRNFKFYLAFENSFCKDYMTEKAVQSYQFFRDRYLIPVFRGTYDYDKYLPPGTYINAGHFPSAKDLMLYLEELGRDIPRYAKMLREVDRVTTIGWFIDWCDICEKVHTTKETKIIPDIFEWTHGRKCHPPMDDPIFYPEDTKHIAQDKL